VFLFPCPPPVSTTDADRFLCWPQAFKELCQTSSIILLSPLSFSGCKSTAFFITRNTFFDFLNFFYITLIIKCLKTIIFSKNHEIHGEKPSFSAQRCIFWSRFYGKFTCF